MPDDKQQLLDQIRSLMEDRDLLDWLDGQGFIAIHINPDSPFSHRKIYASKSGPTLREALRQAKEAHDKS